MTSEFSMQAMTRSVPPHLGQVSMSMAKTRRRPAFAGELQQRLEVPGVGASERVKIGLAARCRAAGRGHSPASALA